jgi:hypothetical protein
MKASDRFEHLYLTAVKQICLLEEQVELLVEVNSKMKEKDDEQKKELKSLRGKLTRLEKKQVNK